MQAFFSDIFGFVSVFTSKVSACCMHHFVSLLCFALLCFASLCSRDLGLGKRKEERGNEKAGKKQKHGKVYECL